MAGVMRCEDDEAVPALPSLMTSSSSRRPRASSKRTHVGCKCSEKDAGCRRCRFRIWREVREWLYTEAVVAIAGGVGGGGEKGGETGAENARRGWEDIVACDSIPIGRRLSGRISHPHRRALRYVASAALLHFRDASQSESIRLDVRALQTCSYTRI